MYRAIRWLVRYGLTDDLLDEAYPWYSLWPTTRHVLAFAGLCGVVVVTVAAAFLMYVVVVGG